MMASFIVKNGEYPKCNPEQKKKSILRRAMQQESGGG